MVKITLVQCRMIRDRYDGDETVPDLAEDIDVSTSAIWRHTAGECKHAAEWQTLGRDDMTGSVADDHSVRNMSPTTRILTDPDVTTVAEARRRIADHYREESA